MMDPAIDSTEFFSAEAGLVETLSVANAFIESSSLRFQHRLDRELLGRVQPWRDTFCGQRLP